MATGSGNRLNPASGRHTAVIRRYTDAYRVGSAIVALGTAIKVVGVVLAVLVLLVMLGTPSNPFTGPALKFAGIILSITIAVAGWVWGVIVTAQGQILRATLDTAVANSPFLNDGERGEAMGIPAAAAAAAETSPIAV